MISIEDLIFRAKEACKNSYSPYSCLSIGAAVLTKSGKIFTGTNIENGSFGATICAERVAILKAVSEGEKQLEKIAITTTSKSAMPFPCGMCRQVMSEFNPNMEIIIASENGKYEVYNLSEMLPKQFEFRK